MSTPALEMIPIDRIEVLNQRDRNARVFAEIAENIQKIGLKKPIVVTPRGNLNGEKKYLLVCGEGRLKAFRSAGEQTIPTLVIDVSDEDAFIMSLAENIARRKYRPLERMADCHRARKQVSSRFVLKPMVYLSFDSALGITMRHRTVCVCSSSQYVPATLNG